MILNQTAEYAFRAMACLAICHEDGPMRASDLSEKTNIPSFYLSKVMRRLVVAGLVDSQRGRGGGFVLTRPPSGIRFADILDAVDYSAEQGRCAFGFGQCNDRAPCPLHASWSELQQGFNQWASTHTLAGAADGAHLEWIKRARASGS
jgi:Rrf2 family iron-sulfur cluster assembly transcriptional regulator